MNGGNGGLDSLLMCLLEPAEDKRKHGGRACHGECQHGGDVACGGAFAVLFGRCNANGENEAFAELPCDVCHDRAPVFLRVAVTGIDVGVVGSMQFLL